MYIFSEKKGKLQEVNERGTYCIKLSMIYDKKNKNCSYTRYMITEIME